MSFKIVHSIPATLDLDGIIHYIAFRLNNPTAASNLLDEYENRLTNLRESPRFYGPAHIESLAHRGFHQFSFGNYIAFYTINDEEQKVNIIRIFYKKQNYEKTL